MGGGCKGERNGQAAGSRSPAGRGTFARGRRGAKTPPPEMTVLVAEGYPLLRYGLCRFLRSHRDLTTVAEARDAAQMLQQLRQNPPRVLLLDYGLPGGGGLRTVAGVHQMFPEMGIVVLMTPGDERHLADVLENGALGSVWKNTAPECLLSAVHAVASGNRWVEQDMTGYLIGELSRLRHPLSSSEKALTPREREVLGLVASGLRNAEVASRLVISEHTVRVHVSNLFHKLRLRDRIQLIHWAIGQGLVTVPVTSVAPDQLAAPEQVK